MPKHLASDRCWKSPPLAGSVSVEKVGDELVAGGGKGGGRPSWLQKFLHQYLPGFGIEGHAINHTHKLHQSRKNAEHRPQDSACCQNITKNL